MEFAAAWLGAAATIDPLDAQLLALHLANGFVEFWRCRIATEVTPSQATIDGYRVAIADLSRFSKSAIDSHVAERQTALAERQAGAIAELCEQGLTALAATGVVMSTASRSAYAKAISDGLRRLESESESIIEGNTEGDGRMPAI